MYTLYICTLIVYNDKKCTNLIHMVKRMKTKKDDNHRFTIAMEILDIEIGKAINYSYPGGEYIALNYDGVETRYNLILLL